MEVLVGILIIGVIVYFAANGIGYNTGFKSGKRQGELEGYAIGYEDAKNGKVYSHLYGGEEIKFDINKHFKDKFEDKDE
jgi:hypothetical protein